MSYSEIRTTTFPPSFFLFYLSFKTKKNSKIKKSEKGFYSKGAKLQRLPVHRWGRREGQI